jgi:hypothetical protein
MKLLERAHLAITAATAGDRLQRERVIEWYELRQQATGEEAELIDEAGEALMVAAADAADRQWLQALATGGPAAAERMAMAQRMQDEGMQFKPTGRGDAADQAAASPADPGKAIDTTRMDHIDREVAIMVELNRKSNELWQQELRRQRKQQRKQRKQQG